MAFSTAPDFRHLVQTYIFFTLPLTLTFTCWRFGFHLLAVTLCAWLILLPKTGPLPQTSHL